MFRYYLKLGLFSIRMRSKAIKRAQNCAIRVTQEKLGLLIWAHRANREVGSIK